MATLERLAAASERLTSATKRLTAATAEQRPAAAVATAAERLILPIAPDGKLTGYALEQLTLRHLEEWDEDDGWTVMTGHRVACPLAFTSIEPTSSSDFYEVCVDADGHVYANRDKVDDAVDAVQTCLRLYRIRFDAGPIVGSESLRQGEGEDYRVKHANLVSGMVCYYDNANAKYANAKWLHIVHATPDGDWMVTRFEDAHERGTMFGATNLRYAYNLRALCVPTRDDYVLK